MQKLSIRTVTHYNVCMSDRSLDILDNETPPADLSEMVNKVSELVMEGQSISSAARSLGYKPGAIHKAANDYPILADQISSAQEIWAELAVDGLIDLPQHNLNPVIMKMHSENIRWTAARRNRKRFGDNAAKIQDNSAGLVDVLREAIERIPRPMHDVKTIDND